MKGVFIFVLLIIINYHVVGQSTGMSARNVAFRSVSGVVYKISIRDTAFKFDHADYSIFIPGGTTYIRGIFIHQHGCGMEGTGAATAYDIQYEAFAKKWHLAVIGPDLYPTKGAGCEEWINPEDGSGPALLAAIDSFSRFSGHPELNKVPWLLWGHSGGGYWVLKMMSEYPNRILAAFCYSAAFDPDITFPSASADIPIILRHAGKDDCCKCWQTATHTFIKLRSMGSFASLAYTPGQTHNFSYVRYMAIPFFESVLKQRLPDHSFSSSLMKNMNISRAWLGDTLTHRIYKLSEYKGDKTGLCLLPDSVTAAKWREYVSTGTVIDHSPPPAPYDLMINKKESTSDTYLTWKVRGDVESPIRYFNIYKNEKIIGRFPKEGDYQTFDTNGDNAVPLIPPEIKFKVDPAIKKSDTFSVSEVNQFNLESPKTEIAVSAKPVN